MIIVSACGGGENVAVPLPASDTALCVALGADYQSLGTMAVIGLPSLTVIKDMVPNAISKDPVLRLLGRRLYVVNRSANNVTVIDPTTSPWAVEAQFSTGPGTNPQDIALAGTRAYVTLYDKPQIQVWDLSAGPPAAPAASIDTSSYDVDSSPDANSIVIVDGYAYVTLDRLDETTFRAPRGNGKVLVIDTRDNRVVRELELRYSNPYDFMYLRAGRLLVATFTDFSGSTGCLEQIVPGADPSVGACLVENRDVEGVINSIALGPADTYLAVSAFDADFKQTAEIRRLASDGTLVPDPMTPAGQIPTDVAWAPSGHLVYSDAKGGGVRVIDLAAGREITTGPLDIGLKPATANAIACMSR